MKMAALLFGFACNLAFAFDPAGPPPKQTIEWTTNYLMKATFPAVEFDNLSAEEATAFAGSIEIPKEYTVRVKIPNDESVLAKKITIKARGITKMALIAAIAEQANLDILIKPGAVILVPRKPNVEQGGGKSGDPVESK